jgi:hypothetical protein
LETRFGVFPEISLVSKEGLFTVLGRRDLRGLDFGVEVKRGS